MSSLTRNFSILWRSERLLAEAEWRRSSRQLTILAVAGVFALLAIIMFNFAGFYWLASHHGNAVAALGVGVVDLIIAAISAIAAQSLTMPRETEMIREFRDTAVSEIEEEAAAVQAQLVQIRDDVQVIGTTVSKVASDPIGTLSPALLVPAITTLTSALRSSRKS